jgi:hypothetical protein
MLSFTSNLLIHKVCACSSNHRVKLQIMQSKSYAMRRNKVNIFFYFKKLSISFI